MDQGGTGIIAPAQPGELEGITISEWIASRLWVDYGTPFAFDGRPYLKKIHDLEEKKILFRTGRQVEKSVRLSSDILMADGSWKRAGDIRVGDLVASFDEKTQTLKSGMVTWKSEVYKKDCRRITTALGHLVEVADTHPVWTGKGWVPAGDLHVRERVAAVRSFGEFGEREVDERRISLTALMIGDGYCGESFQFCQLPGPVMDEFMKHLKGVGDTARTTHRKETKCVYQHIRRGVLFGWMKEDGLSGMISATKFIPAWVFQLNREKAALFLNRLWATDGHVKKNGRSKYSIEYCSMSRMLVKQVQSLLWKFGIPSSVRKNWPSIYKRRGEEKYAYILRIVTADGVRRFLTEIGALGKSESVPLPDAGENNNRDTLPMEVNLLVYAAIPSMKGSNLTNWPGPRGETLYGNGLRRTLKYPPTRSKLREYLGFLEEHADVHGRDALRVLETYDHDDLYWDRVKRIDELGEQDCCDFTVEGTHSYIVEGLVTHNTSSLAAKLVSWSCLHPNWKSLYVSPSQNQTRVFSHARLDRVLNSPYVRAKFFDPQRGIDFVYEKGFMNGSTVQLNYCSTEADRCVAMDTKVLTPRGEWLTIEMMVDERMIGQELVTFCEKTKRLSVGKVTQFHLNGHRRVGRLVLEGGVELTCTPDHKVWTQAHRWIQAEKVALSRTDDRHLKTVAVWVDGGITWRKAVDFIDCGETEVVDMTMSNDYSYVANGIVAHNCFDRETQILTRSGWKLVREVTLDDELADLDSKGRLCWHRPSAVIAKRHTGKMVRFGRYKGSLRVTDDHDMWAYRAHHWRRKGSSWRFVKASELVGKPFKMRLAPEPFTAGTDSAFGIPSGPLGRLLGWYLAEGSLNGSAVVISQKPGSKLNDILATITDCGLKCSVTDNSTGVKNVRILGASWLSDAFGGKATSRTKRIPSWAFDLNPFAVASMVEAMLLGDGGNRMSRSTHDQTYITMSRGLAEDLQAVLLRIGRASSIQVEMRRPGKFPGKDYSKRPLEPCYRVQIYRDRVGASWKTDTEEVVDEEVYCVTVPHHRVIVKGSFGSSPVVTGQCRGISADMLLADEIQDMTHDVFPVLEEVLSHSPYGYKIYAGTPKTLNNAMETHWKNSTQCEWMVWCSCGEWIFQDEKMIRKEGPTCPKCGKGVDPQFGRWVAYGPEDSEFMGFRIPQTMVPWIAGVPNKWKELVQKLNKWPQQQFYNEVLGLAHEKGANPISESDVKKCCGPRSNLEVKPKDMYFDALYAGVDWGAGLGSYTVLTIGGWSGSKFHVLYIKRFATEKDEPGIQVQMIANSVLRFDATTVGGDWGFGYMQNKELAHLLHGRAAVLNIYESGAKKRAIDWNQKSQMYTMNRNMALAGFFLAIKREEIVFPKWADMSEFAEDITCIFEDYNRTLRMLVYDHPDKMPDDAAHSIVFCMTAMKIARGDKAL